MNQLRSALYTQRDGFLNLVELDHVWIVIALFRLIVIVQINRRGENAIYIFSGISKIWESVSLSVDYHDLLQHELYSLCKANK